VFQAAADEDTVPGMGTAVLEALFRQAPIALYVLDPALRIVACNPAAQAISHEDAEQIVGRRLSDVYDFPASDDVQSVLSGVLESGTPSSERARSPCRGAGRRG
jgi:PAS domain S-box-containing protein